MSTRIGINGFGRIGRDYLRFALDTPDLEVVAVNDVADCATLARLLRSDSTFGRLPYPVEDLGDAIAVNGHKIAVSSQRDLDSLDWARYGVEVVIESTGKFRTRALAGAHLGTGATRVLVSAPGKDLDATIVMGVNDGSYDPERHHVISNASCTTNCVAPMVKVLHETFGIVRGYLTTVHAYTNDQLVLDSPHKDLRRARAAAVNIIPTSTGAAKAVGLVLPELAGRLDGVALRVPVENGSVTDLTCELGEPATVSQINAAMRTAAQGTLNGILRYTDDPIVSRDIVGDPASCVFDSGLTQAAGTMAKVFGWYDNEWGYTNRLVDLTVLLSARS